MAEELVWVVIGNRELRRQISETLRGWGYAVRACRSSPANTESQPGFCGSFLLVCEVESIPALVFSGCQAALVLSSRPDPVMHPPIECRGPVRLMERPFAWKELRGVLQDMASADGLRTSVIT